MPPPEPPPEGVRFVVRIHEITARGYDDSPWVSFVVPAAGAGAVAKDGHTFYRVTYPTPVCIPARGLVRALGGGDGGAAAIYEKGVPTIAEASAAGSGASLEERFPGYGALAETVWLQLNPGTDPLAIQVRLRKILPRAPKAPRAPRGEAAQAPSAAPPGAPFHVYGVDTLVVHVALPNAAAADRKKALDI